MIKYFIIFTAMFITFRVIHNPDYGAQSGVLVIQLTEKSVPAVSNVGVKLFDFEL